jgi:hypothetical protein
VAAAIMQQHLAAELSGFLAGLFLHSSAENDLRDVEICEIAHLYSSFKSGNYL